MGVDRDVVSIAAGLARLLRGQDARALRQDRGLCAVLAQQRPPAGEPVCAAGVPAPRPGIFPRLKGPLRSPSGNLAVVHRPQLRVRVGALGDPARRLRIAVAVIGTAGTLHVAELAGAGVQAECSSDLIAVERKQADNNVGRICDQSDCLRDRLQGRGQGREHRRDQRAERLQKRNGRFEDTAKSIDRAGLDQRFTDLLN